MNRQYTTFKYVLILAPCLLIMLCAGDAYGVARLLEYDWTVNDSESYSFHNTTNVEVVESGETIKEEIECTFTYTVDVDNQDGSFEIDCETTNVTHTVDDGTPENWSGGSDSQTVENDRGRILAHANPGLLFPDMVDDNWDAGEVEEDQTGPWASVAVDVDDTWTQDIRVKPYGYENWQTMTITWKLLEWTTLKGYNVAKVKGTWTQPFCAYNSSTGETISGDLSCTEYVYFSYDENIIVDVDDYEATGTLTDMLPGNDPYDMDMTTTITSLG